MSRILEGVRILEVAQWWFVPSGGAVLADWGADVIKVEHPVQADPQRGLMTSGLVSGETGINFMMEHPNRGKRSVALDMKTEGGRELLYRLAESADVFLTSFLPNVRERLQIDVEHIRARNPNIIYVRGSGQGARGPHKDKAGYDASSYWSRSGVAHMLTPTDRDSPIGQRPAFGDGTGGMTIAGGIAGALFHRERTGEAKVVDISLLHTAMWVLSPDINMSQVIEDIPRAGGRGVSPNPVVGNYRTQDDRWIQFVLLQADRDWPDFCQHIERPDLIEDPRFVDMAARAKNAAECVATLDEVFASRPLAEWRKRLETLRGAWTVIQTPREVLDDVQVEANGYMGEVEVQGGENFKLVTAPVQYDEETPALSPGPEHGEHTDEVLLELGLSMDEVMAHKVSGAIL